MALISLQQAVSLIFSVLPKLYVNTPTDNKVMATQSLEYLLRLI